MKSFAGPSKTLLTKINDWAKQKPHKPKQAPRIKCFPGENATKEKAVINKDSL